MLWQSQQISHHTGPVLYQVPGTGTAQKRPGQFELPPSREFSHFWFRSGEMQCFYTQAVQLTSGSSKNILQEALFLYYFRPATWAKPYV